MASIITIAGEKLFAAKAQANEPLDIDTFIFANIPGQDPAAPINREEGIPVAHQVHQQIVQQVGRINENVVVYSTVMDSLTGPFEFNWVGLYSSVNQTLVAINHIPTTSKTITEPGTAGNTLNRNFGIEYSGIADLTGITVAPETWQLDFTARLGGMDRLTQQLAADMNGKDWFIGDGFKVIPRATANTFSVMPGVGYVSGLRIELKQEHILTLQSYPQFVYVDAWFSGTANSVWAPQVAFTVTDAEMDDHIDVSGVQHYVFKLAVVNAADDVEDLREENKLAHKSWVEEEAKILARNSTSARTLSDRFSDRINALDNGIVGDGKADDSDAFEALIRRSVSEKVTVYIPKRANIFLEKDIDVSDLEGFACFVGDYAGIARDLRQADMAEITFNDNGKSTDSRIQVNAGDLLSINLINIRMKTLVDDVRNLLGNFVGIKGKGTDAIVRGCDISGFATALSYCDLGYCYWGGNNYHGNKTMLKHRLVRWPNGTTFVDEASVGTQNHYIYDCPSLFHSRWVNGIYEYNKTPIKDINSGCMISGSYFEFNSEGGLRSDNAADIIDTNNFFHDAINDGFYTSNNTTQHGFDRCGKTRVTNRNLAAKDINTYDRSGYLSDFISSAKSGAIGFLELFRKSGNKVGKLVGLVGDTKYNAMNRVNKIRIWKGEVDGLPSNMTFTKNEVGDYLIVFDSSIRPPHVDISCTPTTESTSGIGKAEAHYQMIASAGGNWSQYFNANGIRINTKFGGVLSDNVCVFLTIYDEV